MTINQDAANHSVHCEWWNGDGHTERSASVRRDATAPTVEASASRGPDSNGWYNRGLTVEFSGSDAMSGLASCSADKTYSGPDSGVASLSGSCTDRAGNVRTRTFGLQYDATAPDVRAKPDRRPDRKGWYNRKLRVEFVGTDATSGISSCAPAVTYQGPDAPKTALSGTCTDKAANTSSATAELRYDTSPPLLGRLRAELRKHGIVLRWTASEDASSFAVVRQPGLNGSKPSTIYSGPAHRFVDRNLTEDVKYRYTISAYDEAGNAAVKGLRLRAHATTKPATTNAAGRPALAKPPNGARLASPPLLDWTAVPEASYYNVQLFRDGKKILTAWPGSTSFRLGQTWKFDGRTHRLSPGRYRWYVWPGFGPRSASRYGKLLGTRTFVVTR